MDFYNQSWFWAGFFAAFGSLGGILIKEWISSKSKLNIERLKIYESDLFIAYNDLYHFISKAYDWLYPPDDPVRDFNSLMGSPYFRDIKKQLLYFNSDIRKIIGKLESQYRCMGDPDLIPEKPFDKFYDKDLLNLLGELEKNVKLKTDHILQYKK